MIALLRPQPDARSVGQPEPAALGLLMRDLQPLALPDTLDPLVVDCPARPAQQFGDLAIAIAAVLPSKLDNIGGETLLVLTAARDLALRRAMLPERRTGATLGDIVVIAAFGRAVALGVFAPDAPRRRLIAVDDVTARSLASHLVWGTRALGALVLALAVHKALAAPAAMTIATNMLFALVIGALLVHLLLSHRSGAAKEKTPGVARWLRGLGWLVLGGMAIAR